MGTSIPNRKYETPGSPPSEVKIYKLSPEEIANLPESKPLPRNYKKPMSAPVKKPVQVKPSEIMDKVNQEEQPKTSNSNIQWLTVPEVIEGPTIAFYQTGFAINRLGADLLKIKAEDYVTLGYDPDKQQILILTGSNGVKLKSSSGSALRTTSKFVTNWIESLKVKKQKYIIQKTELDTTFRIDVEHEE